MKLSGDVRDGLDIPQLLLEVVAPALSRVLHRGELDSVSIGWVDAVQLPGGEWSKPTQLQLRVVCLGELMQTNLWMVGVPTFDSDIARERLISELQDFVAESSFGWGELRQ